MTIRVAFDFGPRVSEYTSLKLASEVREARDKHKAEMAVLGKATPPITHVDMYMFLAALARLRGHKVSQLSRIEIRKQA